MNEFIQKRLNSYDISFWEPVASLKIKKFDLSVKKVAVKAADEKMFTIGGDRDLFRRLLLAAAGRNVDIQEVLSYELASVPISLAHPDGSLRKTAKNVLLSILEEDEIVEPRLPKRQGISVTHIIDGMALVQATKSSGAATFGVLSSKYFEIVTSPLKERDCCRVDIVFDQYWPNSIKSADRKKQGEGNALEIVINSPSTPVPKQWQKYVSNPRNKTNLVSFLSESWRKTAMEQLPLRKVHQYKGEDVSIQVHYTQTTRKLTRDCYYMPSMLQRMAQELLSNRQIPMYLSLVFHNAKRLVVKNYGSELGSKNELDTSLSTRLLQDLVDRCVKQFLRFMH